MIFLPSVFWNPCFFHFDSDKNISIWGENYTHLFSFKISDTNISSNLKIILLGKVMKNVALVAFSAFFFLVLYYDFFNDLNLNIFF